MVLASSFLGRHRRDGLGITDLWYEVKARTPVKLFGMSLIDKGCSRFGELGLCYAQLSDDRWLKTRTIAGSRSSLSGRERVEELGGPIGVVYSLVALTSVKRY